MNSGPSTYLILPLFCLACTYVVTLGVLSVFPSMHESAYKFVFIFLVLILLSNLFAKAELSALRRYE